MENTPRYVQNVQSTTGVLPHFFLPSPRLLTRRSLQRKFRGFSQTVTGIEIGATWARCSRATSASTARRPPPSPANAPPPLPYREVILQPCQISSFPGSNLGRLSLRIVSWLVVWPRREAEAKGGGDPIRHRWRWGTGIPSPPFFFVFY